jgi:exosortase family protein XrtM
MSGRMLLSINLMKKRWGEVILYPFGFLFVSTLLGALFEILSKSALESHYLNHIATLSGQIIRFITPNDRVLVFQNGVYGRVNLQVASTCSGLGFIALLGAAIIMFSTSIQHKLIGLVAGILFVAALNIGRIVCLYFAMSYHPGWFLWLHLYVAPTLMVILCCQFFVSWSYWTMYKRYG